jgi:hypothetical protein
MAATYSTGITVTWNSVTFFDVTELKTKVGGKLPISRGGTANASVGVWSLDMGAIDIVCLHTANISQSQYGLKSTIAITGGGMAFTSKAICESFTMAAAVNNVARYAASFKLVKET